MPSWKSRQVRAAVVGDVDAAVVVVDQVVAVVRVDPQAVVVAVEPGRVEAPPGLAAVGRLRKAQAHDVDRLGRARVDPDLPEDPAVGAAEAVHARRADLAPAGPRVVGAVDLGADDAPLLRPAVGVLLAGFGLGARCVVVDIGVECRRLRPAKVDADAPGGDRVGQPGVDRRPGLAAVRRLEQAVLAAGPGIAPAQADAVPGRGVQGVGRLRVHDEIVRPDPVVDEQDFLPGGSAIGCLVDAAVGIGGPLVARGRDVDDVGILRVDDDPGDGVGLLEPHGLPGLPGVGRFEDAEAGLGAAEDVGFARSGPDDVRIGFGDGQVADRHRRHIVEDGLPGRPGVDGLEDAARGRAGIEDRAAAGGDGDVGAPPAEVGGADEPPLDVLEGRGLLHRDVLFEGLQPQGRIGVLDLLQALGGRLALGGGADEKGQDGDRADDGEPTLGQTHGNLH